MAITSNTTLTRGLAKIKALAVTANLTYLLTRASFARYQLYSMKNEHVQVHRISREDHEAVVETAKHLGLSQSEIMRRALRIALPILKDLNLPGSPKRVEERTT